MLESVNPQGRLRLTLRRPGRPPELMVSPNLVVGIARDALAGTLMGIPFGPALSHIQFSDNTTPARLTDTEPGPPVDSFPLVRPLRKLWMPDTGIMQADFTLPAGEYIGPRITEFSLLRETTAHTYILFARIVRTPITMTPDLQIEGVWVISFNP